MRYVILGVVAAATLACTPTEVKLEEELITLKNERRTLVDELYRGFGKGELAAAVDDKAREAAATESDDVAKSVLRAVGNLATEVDRAAFEEHCLTLGRGERPTVVDERGKAYFARQDVRPRCERVAKIDVRMRAVERDLHAARARRK